MATGKGKQATQFRKGKSGNPAGRPKGSRNALQESFVKDCYEAWQANGKDVLARTIEEKPADFLKVIAGLLPKEATLHVEHNFLDYLKALNESQPRSIESTGKVEDRSGPIRH